MQCGKRWILMAILGLLMVTILNVVTAAPLKDGWIVKKGQAAPQFELKDVNGKSHKLSDYAGSVVVLAFWDTY